MLIAICDDEQFFLDYFEKTIKEYYNDKGVECKVIKYHNGFDLVSDLQSKKINVGVVVLDIEMPDYRGTDIVRDIRKFNTDIPIMFLSSIETCGDVAAEYNLCMYIYKSAGEAKIYHAFDKLLAEERYMKYTYEIMGEKVFVHKIMYIKVKSHYAEFHLENKILSERNSLNNYLENSKFEKFILLNRNIIVNYKFISAIKDKIYLSNGEKLRFSDSRQDSIIKKYFYLINERYR